jgi:rubrerythrin
MITLKQLKELYTPKSPDEKRFVDKHIIKKTADANKNGDDVFNGKNIKADNRAPYHGYNPGDDEKVYESVRDDPEYGQRTRQRNRDNAKRLQDREGDPEYKTTSIPSNSQGMSPERRAATEREFARLKKQYGSKTEAKQHLECGNCGTVVSGKKGECPDCGADLSTSADSRHGHTVSANKAYFDRLQQLNVQKMKRTEEVQLDGDQLDESGGFKRSVKQLAHALRFSQGPQDVKAQSSTVRGALAKLVNKHTKMKERLKKSSQYHINSYEPEGDQLDESGGFKRSSKQLAHALRISQGPQDIKAQSPSVRGALAKLLLKHKKMKQRLRKSSQYHVNSYEPEGDQIDEISRYSDNEETGRNNERKMKGPSIPPLRGKPLIRPAPTPPGKPVRRPLTTALYKKEEVELDEETYHVIHKKSRMPGTVSSRAGQNIAGVTIKDKYHDRKEAEKHARHLDKHGSSDGHEVSTWINGKLQEEVDLEEGGMPSSVIRTKQKYDAMTDREFADLHGHKTQEQLRQMAWRHGYGKMSPHYWNRVQKAKATPMKEEVDLDEGKLRRKRIIKKWMNSDRSDPNLERDANKAFETGFNRDVENYRRRTGVENYRRRLANSYEPEGDQINELSIDTLKSYRDKVWAKYTPSGYGKPTAERPNPKWERDRGYSRAGTKIENKTPLEYEPKVHDLTHIKDDGDVYNHTQTSDEIRDGDVMKLHGGRVATMYRAWPVMHKGTSDALHSTHEGKTIGDIGERYKKTQKLADKVASTMKGGK